MSALTEALVAAQKELPTAIERDAQGYGRDEQGYSYRYTTLDKLIGETRPILSKHGIAITQWPCTIPGEDGGLRPALCTRLSVAGADVAVESWEMTMPLYVVDKTSQSHGSAITYARRYAWAAALGIASEEDTDAATLKPEDDVPF